MNNTNATDKKCDIFFICSTNTDVGKTFFTGHYAKYLKELKGKNIITQKLIQTGCKGISEDILEHRKIMNCPLFSFDEDLTTCPIVFSYPASPHIASKIDNESICFDKITNSTKILSENFDTLLIETAGGLMTPLTEDFLTIDYIKSQNHPVIFVCPSTLGSISNALLNLQILKTYSIKIDKFIYNNYPKEKQIIETSSKEFLKNYIAKNFPQTSFEEIGKFLY